MAVLLTDRRLSPELAEWAASRIAHVGAAGFGPCSAVGIASRGQLAAVAVWHDFQPRHGTLQVSIASATPSWANRHIFGRVLALAFEQTWGNQAVWIDKVWAAMPSDAPRTIEFNVAIGFKREATLRHHYGRGRHAVIASMMSWEFKRLYRSGHVLPTPPLHDVRDTLSADAKAEAEGVHA
jgi:hypothetical protein